jgi:hypothetical protein
MPNLRGREMSYIFDMTTGYLLEQRSIDARSELTLIEGPVEISCPTPRLETVAIDPDTRGERIPPIFLAGPIDDLLN